MLNTACTECASAYTPHSAAAIPAIPKANPKKRPEIIPRRLGSSSCANITMAGNAEESMNPAPKLHMRVHVKLICGSSSVNGVAPSIEAQITYLRPILSPIGPPRIVPSAVEKININREYCDIWSVTENFSIMKNVK